VRVPAAGTGPEPVSPAEEERWIGRPALARAVRAAVFAGPLLVSLVVTTVATRMSPAPQGHGRLATWLVGLLVLSTTVVWVTDRLLRRLMPLAALLEMSVLFPGRAPTRFSVARQSGTTRQLEELVAKARESDENTEPIVAASRILALVGALRTHDRATRGHSERVRVLTDLVAEEMGLATADRDRLRWAALLHDIGKLDVPAKILNKPGRPTPREWERLKNHPAVGQELAAPLLDWLGAYAPVIIQHHERWDGTGYPAGLAGHQICTGARIVAVADAFEVMTAARSYKRPMSRAVALREMTRQAGTQFDPAVVRALLSISAPRLRWAIGPMAWVAQLPIIGTAPSLASVTSVAGQAAAGAGAVGLGTAVGLTSLTPERVTGEVDPQVLPGIVLQQPEATPSTTAPTAAAQRTPGPGSSPTATGSPGTAVRTVASTGSPSPSPSATSSPSPGRRRPTATGKPAAATVTPSATPTTSPSPSPSPGRGRPSRGPTLR
jgi:putative nucleotidyltransferase with HDIG domain